MQHFCNCRVKYPQNEKRKRNYFPRSENVQDLAREVTDPVVSIKKKKKVYNIEVNILFRKDPVKIRNWDKFKEMIKGIGKMK